MVPLSHPSHGISLYHTAISAQLYHNALFGTIMLHYKLPLCLTISTYDVLLVA